MKTLIVEDDFTSRVLLQRLLKGHGDSHVAINGLEAVEAACTALDSGEPYDLICLDIMLPEMDGHEALTRIREHEKSKGISSSKGAKIMMTSSLKDVDNVSAAYRGLCDSYLTKPIDVARFNQTLEELGLV